MVHGFLRGPSLALVVVAGCSSDELVPGEPTSRIDLRAALGVTDANVVGVTVAPDSDRQFLLDTDVGLVELDGDGNASVAIAMTAMPDPGVEVRLPYTDVVALGNEQFALTAIGDGFLLDVAARTSRLHFCYEPGFMPDDFNQRTDSVTYDAARDEIIAQPQTFDGEGALVQADVGFFDRASGFDLEWKSVDQNMLAGGIAAVGASVYLGRGSKLLHHDRATGMVVEVDDLARFGVGRIEGLAHRAGSASLLVVDGEHDELVEIALEQLSAAP
jgi:hypothetical protein